MSIPGNLDIKSSLSQVFMLRFWSEDMGDGWVDWRGRVQHVNSGEVIYFHDWLILEKFIQDFLGGFPLVEVKGEGKLGPTGKPPVKQS